MSDSVADPFGWVGATVDGKYRVDGVVGEGGFGIVYRAHHLGFGETVALKCLRVPESLAGQQRERFFESFLAEGRLLHRLSRSTAGIVQALDVGAEVSPKGVWTPYLVLEWLAGHTLDLELSERRERKLGGRSLAEAIALLDPAARALAIAHDQGVAHRDVKPANLFMADVAGKTTLKVLDFGIAKVITETASMTRAFEATGGSLQAFTAAYGSPEQFSRRFGATGPWSDVFALALVFVELVAGRRALEGEDTAQLFVSSADTQHRPTLRGVGVDSPIEFEAVLLRALAVSPKERYTSAGEFWDALIAAAESAGIREPMPSSFGMPSLSGAGGGEMPPLVQALSRDNSSLSHDTPQPSYDTPASSQDAPTKLDRAQTELASTSQVPEAPPRGSLLSLSGKPEPKRVAIAVLIATGVFGAVASIGALVWSGGDEGPALPSASTDLTLPSSTAAAQIPPPPSRSSRPAVTRSGGVLPPPVPSVPPSTPSGPIVSREIPAGLISEQGGWLRAFRVVKIGAQPAAQTLYDARTRCAAEKLTLCTESQWRRACSVQPDLGRLSSWTLSGDGERAVVRGGGQGCEAKESAAPDDTSPRFGLCCDPGIAIDTDNDNSSFLAATSDRLIELQSALNRRDVKAFGSVLAPTVVLDGTPRTRAAVEALVTKSFVDAPDQWLSTDACKVTVQKLPVVKKRRWRRKTVRQTATWTALCSELSFSAGSLFGARTTYVIGGSGRVQTIARERTKSEP